MSVFAGVWLWGTRIGAVSMGTDDRFAVFQFDPDFAAAGIDVSPLVMRLRREPYTFPYLGLETFRGLPGMLADSLPDKFGNELIDTWLAAQGRPPDSFNSVERLCYIGRRGMGALEFEPTRGPEVTADHDLQIAALVELASKILADRTALVGSLEHGEREQAMRDILTVGTSAGGARAKALIAWNPATGEVRSGQLELPPGFEHWLIKFDGVAGNRDRDRLADPQGYGAIEYAYWLMARDAGISMSAARLFEEDGRRHFMTRRFDRNENGSKRHMQSLGAIAHLDYNRAGSSSYEQAFLVMRQLGLQQSSIEQMFRRMTFNIVARNQDDHVKNIAFTMDRTGVWELAPAFDVTYAYRPSSDWTNQHQLSMAGKRDRFTRADFAACGRSAMLARGRALRILDDVRDVVEAWRTYARSADVDGDHIRRITPALRLELPAG